MGLLAHRRGQGRTEGDAGQHGFRVGRSDFRRGGQGGRDGRGADGSERGIVVDEAEEGSEFGEIHTHLIDELAERHLLGAGKPVEVAAVGPGVFDGLDGGDAEQGTGLIVGDFGRERHDSAPVALPGVVSSEVLVEFSEHLLQTGRIETGGLPKLRG